jgi:hypothetical protein
MIETDPIDALTPAPGIAVAHLNPPNRRISFPHIFEGAFHRVFLAIHAPGFPAANETDVEDNRIVERRRRTGSRFGRGRSDHGGDCRSNDCPPHQRPN